MKNISGDIVILHMCAINDNHVMYGSLDMEHERQNFLSFRVIFCPFTPLVIWKSNFWKKEFWKKMKKKLGNIILHMCTINDNHMIYSSWNMECKWQNFLSFQTIFYPFTLLTTRKIKILNQKKCLVLLPFYTCVP